jgi:hypothetical protein
VVCPANDVIILTGTYRVFVILGFRLLSVSSEIHRYLVKPVASTNGGIGRTISHGYEMCGGFESCLQIGVGRFINLPRCGYGQQCRTMGYESIKDAEGATKIL